MSSLWKGRYNNLTTEERQGVHAAIETQPPLSDPHGVLRRLRLAHKKTADAPTTAEQFSSMETFDLDNLNEVAEEYEKLSGKYREEEEIEMASKTGFVNKYASFAGDEKSLPEHVLAAELDLYVFNILCKIAVPFYFCLRHFQLFNIEKKFGFVEESYKVLSDDDRNRRGVNAPADLSLSFRQKMENPFKPPKPVPKPRKKGKKRPSALETLTELQRNCRSAIDEVKKIEIRPTDAEESVEPPSIAPICTYADVPIPEDIPDNIRQRFFDAESAFGEVLLLQEEASKQLLNVRSTFVAWYSASQEIWYVN